MKPLRVGVPTGLGDVVWSLTKLESILESEQREQAEILVCVPHEPTAIDARAFDLIQAFPFVSSVRHIRHPIHPPGRHWEMDGFLYLESGKIDSPDLDFLLIANHYVERGIPLTRFLPQYDTNFDLLEQIRVRQEVLGLAFKPFVTLYLSAAHYYDRLDVGFNRRDGGQKGWTLNDWVETAKLIHDALGQRLVVVGAKYDNPLAERFCLEMKAAHPRIDLTNLCDTTTGPQLVELLRHTTFTVGYPSGVPILSTYLRRPTVMFWNGNPLHRQARPGGGEDMLLFSPGAASAWVPPGCDGHTYEYLRFGQHGPADVLDAVERFRKRGLV